LPRHRLVLPADRELLPFHPVYSVTHLSGLDNPADGSWKAWKLPGAGPRTYAVYVDEKDKVWLTDFGANAIVRFDPTTEKFDSFPSDMASANVRQLAGRPGETWGGESGTNRLVRIQTVA